MASSNSGADCNSRRPSLFWLYYPLKGFATLCGVENRGDKVSEPRASPVDIAPPEKIDVTRKPPVGGISVVTLIRTDTTLDHSQKAEKV